MSLSELMVATSSKRGLERISAGIVETLLDDDRARCCTGSVICFIPCDQRGDHPARESDAAKDALLHREGDEVGSHVRSRCTCNAAADRTDGNGEVAAEIHAAIHDLFESTLIANDEHDLSGLSSDLQSERALAGEIEGGIAPTANGTA